MDERCRGRRCLKETNPKFHPGSFLGTPYVWEDCWLACHLCDRSYSEQIQPKDSTPHLIRRVRPIPNPVEMVTKEER